MALRAYSYIRMSTAAQAHGTSHQRQLALSKAFAEKHGLELDTRYQDIGVSAFSGRNLTHGALGEFMKAVDGGQIEKGSYLLLESHDRLSRADLLTAVTLFCHILQSGIRIAFLGQGREEIVEDTGRADMLAFVMYAVMDFWRAHSESAHKQDRLAKTWAIKRANIDKKILTARCPGWLRLDDDRSKFSTIPERVEVVRRIFNWAAAGMGEFTIVRKLNASKEKPFGMSSTWQKSSVSRILTSRAVFGEFQPRISRKHGGHPAGPSIQNYFPAIITEAEFDIVSDIRKRTRRLGGGRKGPCVTNLFSKVARCGYCDGPMAYRDRGTKGGASLVCDPGQRGVGCTRAGWNYEDFERSFLTFCAANEITTLFMPKNTTTETGERLAQKQADLKARQSNRERMWAEFESGKTIPGFVSKRFESMESEIHSLDVEVRELAGKLAEEAATNDAQRANLAELPAWIDSLQVAKSDNIYRIRSALSELFRATISSLSICVEGGDAEQKPRSALSDDERGYLDEEEEWYRKQRVEELVDFGHTPEEAHAYVERVRLSDSRRRRYFKVQFTNGTNISVTPHPHNPEAFLWHLGGSARKIRLGFIDDDEANAFLEASRRFTNSGLMNADDDTSSS